MRAVGAPVGLVADAEEAEVEQAHRARQAPFPGEAAAGQAAGDLGAQVGEHGGDLQDVVVLARLLPLTEPRVVEVLAASRRVGADGLDVAVGPGADPHVPPGGRDDQPAQALLLSRIVEGTPRGVRVAESASAAGPRDPGTVDVARPQPHGDPPAADTGRPSVPGPARPAPYPGLPAVPRPPVLTPAVCPLPRLGGRRRTSRMPGESPVTGNSGMAVPDRSRARQGVPGAGET